MGLIEKYIFVFAWYSGTSLSVRINHSERDTLVIFFINQLYNIVNNIKRASNYTQQNTPSGPEESTPRLTSLVHPSFHSKPLHTVKEYAYA